MTPRSRATDLVAPIALLCALASCSTTRRSDKPDTTRDSAIATTAAGVPGHSSSILKVGDQMPAIRAIDQFGMAREFDNLKGPNGLVVVFFKSADW